MVADFVEKLGDFYELIDDNDNLPNGTPGRKPTKLAFLKHKRSKTRDDAGLFNLTSGICMS